MVFMRTPGSGGYECTTSRDSWCPSIENRDGWGSLARSDAGKPPYTHPRLTLPTPFNRLRTLRTTGLPFLVGSIDVRLPDGSVKEVPRGTTALDGAGPVSSLLSE